MQLMNKDELENWIKSLPGHPTVTGAAETARIQRTTLLRQLGRGAISAENVIRLSRAHGKSPVDGLLETGHIDEDEMQFGGIPLALGRATNQQILDEVMQRIEDPDARRLLHGGGITPSATVIPIVAPPQVDIDEDGLSAAARRIEDHPKPE